jgi:hypothetical protein
MIFRWVYPYCFLGGNLKMRIYPQNFRQKWSFRKGVNYVKSLREIIFYSMLFVSTTFCMQYLLYPLLFTINFSRKFLYDFSRKSNSSIITSLGETSGLPDFSRHNVPKTGKMYQITSTLTNGHKIYQMTLKCTNIFHSKGLHNLPKFGILVRKHTIWQP